MIRAVIFDCFGVLCSGSLDYMRSLVSSEKLQEFNDLSFAFDRDYVTRADYIAQAATLLRISPTEVHEIMQNYCIRNELAVELVRSVRKTAKTAMLSNVGRGFIDDFFTKRELQELFDVVVLSSEVGYIKPNPAIYQLAADRLKMLPQECLMIDDSEANVAGARQAGMQGLHYQTFEQCRTDLEDVLGGKYA